LVADTDERQIANAVVASSAGYAVAVGVPEVVELGVAELGVAELNLLPMPILCVCRKLLLLLVAAAGVVAAGNTIGDGVLATSIHRESLCVKAATDDPADADPDVGFAV